MHFIYIYCISGEIIPRFSLPCVFVLLLHDQLSAELFSIIKPNWKTEYSAIFLDLWVVRQSWDWSFHTCLTCLWDSQQYSQLFDHQWFQPVKCNHAFSSETGWWFRSMLNKNLMCASLLGVLMHHPRHSSTPLWWIERARKFIIQS